MIFWFVIILMVDYIHTISKFDKTYFKINLFFTIINSTFICVLGFFYAFEYYKSSMYFYFIFISSLIIFFSPIFFKIIFKRFNNKEIFSKLPKQAQFYRSLIDFLVVLGSCVLGLFGLLLKNIKFNYPSLLLIFYFGIIVVLLFILGIKYHKQLK